MANIVEILVKANTNQAVGGLSKFKSTLGSVFTGVTGLSIASLGLESAVRMLTKGLQELYQAGKEGASLQYAADKFNNLAISIGTTSEALTKDLREATRGMLSDTELMAAASDLMSLGLAKSSDEVIRLANVSTGLGMNMNQLVLTLTNQTTMRFDALGVSVDGFDEKVEKLKKTGMSASDAFNEAFLQQAEQQLELLGEKADSATASFAKLEVAQKNLSDTLKEGVAPASIVAAQALTAYLNAIFKYNQYQKELNASGQEFLSIFPGIVVLYGAMRQKQDETNAATEEFLSKHRQLPDAIEGAKQSIIDANAAISDTSAAASAGQSALASYNLALAGVAQLNQDIAGAQQNLADAQAAWTSGAGGQAAGLLERQKLGTEDYQDALSAIDEVMGTSLLTQDQMNTRLQQANDEYAKSRDLEAYKAALEGIKDQFMPLDEKIKNATDSLQILTDKLDALNGRVIDVLINVQQTNGVTLPPGAPQVPQYVPPSGGGSTTPPPNTLPGGPLPPGTIPMPPGSTTIIIDNKVDSSRAAANVVDAITRR